MNIWDSVHKGLDKASKEAGRIARMQRLRFQLDKVARQLHTQESTLLHQVMDLFMAGQLTQGELLPLCHELMSLQQQLVQAQSELQMLQSQGPQPPQSGQAGLQELNAPATPGGEIAPTMYAPPPPFDATVPAVPPPPPGMDLQTPHSQETVMNTVSAANAMDASTISSQETMFMHQGEFSQRPGDEAAGASIEKGQQSGGESRQHCPQCHVEVLPGYYFCQNCGSALLPAEGYYPPTLRASGSESFYQSGQETVFSPSPEETEREATPNCVPPPPSSTTGSETKDGGH
jgi:hypothetical protein